MYCLNISENNIYYIQDEIFELKNLEQLLINNNRITEIPNKIYKLQNLRNLKIGNVDSNGSFVLFKINDIIERLDISNFTPLKI